MIKSLLSVPFVVIFFLLACKSDTAQVTEEVVAVAQDENIEDAEAAPSFTVWNVAPNPESVTVDGAQVYVTHFGPKLDPMTKDGDGYVAIYDADGTLIDTLVSGLHAPKGSLVRGKTYFVADVDHVLGFNTLTSEKVVDISLEGKSKFLNGLTGGPGNSLFVSGTDAGKIWQVTVSTGEVVEVADVPGANGLAYSTKEQILYAVGYISDAPSEGRVHEINMKTKSSRVLGTYGGMLDGLGYSGDLLFFTDWNPAGSGRMVAMNRESGVHSIVAEDVKFSGPADFDILGDGMALVPMLTGASVLAVRLR